MPSDGDDKAPKPRPTVKSKSPIFLKQLYILQKNLPVPIKSLKPTLNSGNISVSLISLNFKLKLLSLYV